MNDRKQQKLKFSGSCRLSNSELSNLYNLDKLTDEELSSVGVERRSLIDDYRHLHEMSKMVRQPTMNRRSVSKLKKPKFKSPRTPTRAFNYDLLNKFFRCMQSESGAFCRFMEQELKIITDYQRDSKIHVLSQRERELSRYESYIDYLDALYKNGRQDRVISIVGKVMINLHRDPSPVKVLPGFGRGYGPQYRRNLTVALKQKPKSTNI